MSPEVPLTCPQCQAPLAPDDVTCEWCGANIALMTLMVEREMFGRVAEGPEAVAEVTVEQLVPRLGEYLVRKGYLDEAKLKIALEQQSASTAPRRLGQVLVELGFISRETLDHAVAQQILELQSALVEANRTLERRVAERTAELGAALVKLSELNQLKANFVANISHELRTPLAQIKGYVSLLSDGALGPLTAEQEEALAITMRATDRLQQLVDDLIRYAATAKGQLTLNLQAVSLNALVERVLEKSYTKAQRQNLTLTTEVPPNLPPVLADEEKIFWTLSQLVDNAIKFTAAGGRVTIAVTPDEQRLLISVRDTGIGIPAGRLHEIFEPFQQLDSSSTRRYGGTGLGLTLVRRIVEAHGSQVVVESEEGRGSTFTFALPLTVAVMTETQPGSGPG